MLMVGQLVGIVAFSEDLAGSVPSILRLEKFKFTIKKCQSYLLVSMFNNLVARYQSITIQ